MKETFHILFSVALEHDYFSTNRFEGFRVKASEETLHTLQRYEMVYRKQDNRLVVLIREREGVEDMRSLFKEGDVLLEFMLYLDDSLFYNFTCDYPIDIAKEYFVFSNTTKDGQPVNGILLHTGASAGRAAVQTWPGNGIDRKGFAKISIHLTDTMETAYRIVFHSIAVKWGYILVSAHLRGLQQPVILTKDKQEFFGLPREIELPDGRPAVLLKSKSPIQLMQRYQQSFSLWGKDEQGGDRLQVVMAPLPNPDITKMSNVIKLVEKDSYERCVEIIL